VTLRAFSQRIITRISLSDPTRWFVASCRLVDAMVKVPACVQAPRSSKFWKRWVIHPMQIWRTTRLDPGTTGVAPLEGGRLDFLIFIFQSVVSCEDEYTNMTRARDREDRAPARCCYGFDSCRGLRIFLCPTLVKVMSGFWSCWFIHLHISLSSLKITS